MKYCFGQFGGRGKCFVPRKRTPKCLCNGINLVDLCRNIGYSMLI